MSQPVPSAEKPSAFCSSSGRVKSSPNSPSATMSAAIEPNRNDRTSSRPRSTSTIRPAALFLRCTTTNRAMSTTPSARANGTGDRVPSGWRHQP